MDNICPQFLRVSKLLIFDQNDFSSKFRSIFLPKAHISQNFDLWQNIRYLPKISHKMSTFGPFFKKILIDFWSIFQEHFGRFLKKISIDFSRKFRSFFYRFLSKISIFAINVSQIVLARVFVLFVYFYFRKIYFSKFQKNKYFQKKIQNIKNFFVDFSIVFFCSIYS